MATHEQNIENLRSAVYGEQVRGSMIELFEEDYKLVKNGLGVGTDITSPSSSTEGYSDGNVYLNIETQDIWKLENEAWAKKGNMKGIQSIEYSPTTGDGQYNILTITLTDGSAPIVCRIKNGETGNGVESVEVISTVGNVKTYRMTFTDGTHYDWDVQEGGHVIADEDGNVMAQQPTVQFIGANVENDTTTDPSNPVTKVTIPQGGHRIASTLPNGSIMPVGVKREVLEFEGFNVEDNPDPNHLSTVVHGQIKVSPNEQHWNSLSDEEKNDRNIYWFRPWADTVAFATDKTPVGAVLSVATGKASDGITGISDPPNKFPTDDYLVCNAQTVSPSEYPALAKHFKDRYGDTYYFGGTAPGNFSLPNWSSDFPSNGVLVMKARESSNTITFAEIDDTSVSEDKTWSSSKIHNSIVGDGTYVLIASYTDLKTALTTKVSNMSPYTMEDMVISCSAVFTEFPSGGNHAVRIYKGNDNNHFSAIIQGYNTSSIKFITYLNGTWDFQNVAFKENRKELVITATTTASGDYTTSIRPDKFICGLSTTLAVNACFRVSGDGNNVVAHFFDNSQATYANKSVSLKLFYYG